MAAGLGDVRVINLLYRAGADLEARDWRKRTALIAAAKNKQSGAVKRLISYRADLNAKDDEGKTALDHAQRARYMNVIKVILEYQELVSKP
jgi:ankyrin repeat protein